MTEKNIFVYKLSLPLNISYFSLFFVKTATPPEKSYRLFSSNLPLKVVVCQAPPPPPPPVLKIWFNLPAEKGVHTMYYLSNISR